MNFSQLRPPAGQKQKKQRIGQAWVPAAASSPAAAPRARKSVSGYSRMRGFEGGQMPLHRRLPKRGFTNIFQQGIRHREPGRARELEGDASSPDSADGGGRDSQAEATGLKILGSGELTRKITVKAHLFSKSALEKIQAARRHGGESIGASE